MANLLILLCGFMIGIIGGAFGIGGGAFMVPLMVFAYGMTQHQAQGTALAAMLPPVTILAVWKYYQNGNVDVFKAAWLAAGLMAGGFMGAYLVQGIPSPTLKKMFGVLLIGLGVKMLMK